MVFMLACAFTSTQKICIVIFLSTLKTDCLYYLIRNRIARDGGVALARCLRNQPLITILDISSNRIQCEGAVAIANALKEANGRLIV